MKLLDFLITDKNGYPVDVKWKDIININEISALEKCQQSVKWHKEGNALIHTKNVVKSMFKKIKAYPEMSPNHACILIGAALFHDLGKATTTEFKKNDWHSYGHEVESEKILRKLLWDENFNTREILCALVAMHMEPLFYNPGNWFKKMMYAEARLSNIDPDFSVRDLIILKWADTDGSTPSEEGKNDKDLQYLDTLIENSFFCNNILKQYNNSESAVKSFVTRESSKKNITCIVMIGLPGAGKNYWIDNYLPKAYKGKTYGCVSRDDIRVKLGMCGIDEKYLGTSQEEEAVTRVFNTEIKNCAEQYDIVVINNINLRRKYRDSYKEILNKSFNVEWIYVYIEAPDLATNATRRDGQIPANQFPQMIRKFEWPVPEEYDDFYIFFSNDNN